jgi:hypothetical protein
MSVTDDPTPIFILGCRRSGASLIAGLLHEAGGLSLGALAPPTPDHPTGTYETLAITEAHRDLLRQLDRDWTCPPPHVPTNLLDLTYLKESIGQHRMSNAPWGVKDSRLMFLLDAWVATGITEARLVGVIRSEEETTRSLMSRDGLGQLDAERVIALHRRRLRELADQTRIPIIDFSRDGGQLLAQVRRLATALGLDWNEDAAGRLFQTDLVTNRSTFRDHDEAYRSLSEESDLDTLVQATDLSDLTVAERERPPASIYAGPRNTARRSELWAAATFELSPRPKVVELLPATAPREQLPLQGIDVSLMGLERPLHVGSALRSSPRSQGIVASGVLDTVARSDLEEFLRQLFVFTDQLAELVLDLPVPEPLWVATSPVTGPTLGDCKAAASTTGWDFMWERRLSPHRIAIKLRKRLPTPGELLARAAHEEEVEALRIRAADAEAKLAALTSRRSVRIALAASRPFRPLFHLVRRLRK